MSSAPHLDNLAVSTRVREQLVSQRARRLRWLTAAALSLAAAAMLVFQLLPGSGATRFKDAIEFDAYIEQDGKPRRLNDGDIVPPGSKVVFAYRTAEPLHLTLLGIDGAGEMTRYFPRDDQSDHEPLRTGPSTQLPVAVRLDDRRGIECFVALFSERPLSELDALHGLERAFDEARARGASLADMKPLDLPAEQKKVWLNKL